MRDGGWGRGTGMHARMPACTSARTAIREAHRHVSYLRPAARGCHCLSQKQPGLSLCDVGDGEVRQARAPRWPQDRFQGRVSQAPPRIAELSSMVKVEDWQASLVGDDLIGNRAGRRGTWLV